MVKELTSPTPFLTPGTGSSIALGAVEEAHPKVPSFEQVYERHVDFVWRTLRALGVPPTSLEDAAQDVFVVVHRRLPAFEARARITTWLFSIAMRIAREHRKPSRATDDLEEVESGLRDEGPGPFELAARSEAGRLLGRIVDELDEEKRIPFVLMDIEQMTGQEVAELLAVSENTVYSRLRLARAEVNRRSERYRRSTP